MKSVIIGSGLDLGLFGTSTTSSRNDYQLNWTKVIFNNSSTLNQSFNICEEDIDDIKVGYGTIFILTKYGDLYGQGYASYGEYGFTVSSENIYKLVKISSNVKKISVSRYNHRTLVYLKNDWTLHGAGHAEVLGINDAGFNKKGQISINGVSNFNDIKDFEIASSKGYILKENGELYVTGITEYSWSSSSSGNYFNSYSTGLGKGFNTGTNSGKNLHLTYTKLYDNIDRFFIFNYHSFLITKDNKLLYAGLYSQYKGKELDQYSTINGDSRGDKSIYIHTEFPLSTYGLEASKIKKIVSMSKVFFILMEDGRIFYQGLNSKYSPIGNNEDPGSDILKEYFYDKTKVSDIEVSMESLFIIRKDKGIDICGNNGYGNLGDGTKVSIENFTNIYSNLESILPNDRKYKLSKVSLCRETSLLLFVEYTPPTINKINFENNEFFIRVTNTEDSQINYTIKCIKDGNEYYKVDGVSDITNGIISIDMNGYMNGISSGFSNLEFSVSRISEPDSISNAIVYKIFKKDNKITEYFKSSTTNTITFNETKPIKISTKHTGNLITLYDIGQGFTVYEGQKIVSNNIKLTFLMDTDTELHAYKAYQIEDDVTINFTDILPPPNNQDEFPVIGGGSGGGVSKETIDAIKFNDDLLNKKIINLQENMKEVVGAIKHLGLDLTKSKFIYDEILKRTNKEDDSFTDTLVDDSNILELFNCELDKANDKVR